MNKALGETQTLRAGCSKVEPKKFAPQQTLPGGAGRSKFNQLEMVTSFTYRPTNKHTNPQTNRQNRLQYTAPLSLARSVIRGHKMRVLLHKQLARKCCQQYSRDMVAYIICCEFLSRLLCPAFRGH